MSDNTEGAKPWDIEQFRVGREGDRAPDGEPELDAHHQTGHQSGSVAPKFSKDGPSLFWLALKTACLTVLTVGIYRFWMITRLRRHYWNAIRIQGDPLEYTGTGLEKILGFLVAIIILAVYLGLVNLGLMFVGLSYFQGNIFALNISIFAAVPLIFYATYRARRYIMARTRWRGIRFGMDQGAWGYTIRAMWYWFLATITGGLLYPYQQFKLTKYMTDRTWFGDLRFQQNGSWFPLFGYWIWLYIALGLIALAVWGLMADPDNPSTQVIAGLVIFFGYLSLTALFIRYEVAAFRYLWSNRVLGEASFENDISALNIILVYIVGSLLVLVCTLLVSFAVLAAILAVGFYVQGVDVMSQLTQLNQMMNGIPVSDDPKQGITGIVLTLVLFYLVFFAVAFAFTHIFITRPILRRKAEAMVIHNAQVLTQSRQRAHDHAAEAGGFADALGVDVGAGF